MRLLFVSLALFGFVGALGAADGPVTKPGVTRPIDRGANPAEVPRLPAPSPVVAQQRPDGVIEVRWPALEGAVRYQLTRSIPGEPARTIDLPLGGPTVYEDRDVKQDSSYYYVVAAYNRVGVLGLKGSSPPIRAMLPLGGAGPGATGTGAASGATPSSPPIARQEGPNVVVLTWSPPGGSIFERTTARIDRLVRTPALPPRPLGEVDARSGTFRDASVPVEAREVQYQVFFDKGGPPLLSNVVTLAGRDTGGGASNPPGSTGSPGSGPAPTALGSTSFTAGTPVSVRIGASAPAGLGSGGRMISLNDAVARIDATGAVTGVAAGSTHVVALQADGGSLRVTTVQVTVTN